MSEARRRLRSLALTLALSAVAIVALALDASARTAVRRGAEERSAAIVRATGSSELVLSTTSGWLRHPALAAPSAGASDAPLGLDVDPAGAVIPRRSFDRAIAIVREAP